MRPIKQSDPRAAFRRVYFTAVDAADLQSRLTAADMLTFTVRLSKAGGAPAAAAAAAPVELSAANTPGLFYLELAVADIATAGPCALRITNTGGTKNMEPREIAFDVETAYFGTVTTQLSTTSFVWDRVDATDNYWRDVYVRMLTGACAGQAKKIGATIAATGQVTLAPGIQFSAAPAAGDIVQIIDQ